MIPTAAGIINLEARILGPEQNSGNYNLHRHIPHNFGSLVNGP
jgi:hypothetical protein